MIQRKVLSNGMTVVFKQRKNKVVSVAFAVRFGGGNEKAEHKGIAHFIEHMLYKGTSKRNSSQIASEIEKNGGELNGFTSEQLTAFWCKMPSQQIGVALDVLSDIVKNPLFDENELEKERQVIFEEMKMYRDNPTFHVFDKIKNLLYKDDFGLSIIGNKKSMESNTRERLVDFFHKVYVPQNMILCVVGDTDFSKICDFAEKNFVKAEGYKLNKPIVKSKNVSLTEKRKAIDQANMVFAFHSPLPGDNKFYAAQVLSVLMGGGMSSRLFEEIREKRNLAYAIKSSLESEKDYSYTEIYVGAMPENVSKVKSVILEEFEKVAKGITEEELGQIKEQIIGNYLISQEESHNVILKLLIGELRGDAKGIDEFVDRIRAVKLKDVRELAEKVSKKYSFFALVPEN